MEVQLRLSRLQLLAIGFLAGAVIAMVAYFYLSGEPDAVRLRPNDKDAVSRGQAIYTEHCAACHGTNLEGQPNWREPLANGRLPAPPHDETGHTWHHADSLLFDLTKVGLSQVMGGSYESDMPAYGGILSDREIVQVLSFIKSRWPAEIRRQHDRINKAAAATQKR